MCNLFIYIFQNEHRRHDTIVLKKGKKVLVKHSTFSKGTEKVYELYTLMTLFVIK